MADVEFVGHAHAAVELNRVLADEAAGFADLDFRRRCRFLTFGFAFAELQRHHVGDRDGLFVVHEHVDHAVLQHLELADRHAELLAGLAVFDSRVVQNLHGADGFGRKRRDAFVDDLFDQWQAVVRLTDQCVGAEGYVFKRHFGCAQTIDRRIVAARDALRFLVDDEDGDALLVALAAAGAGGYDQRIGPRRADDDGLVAVQRVAGA